MSSSAALCRILGALKTAFVQGRLDKEELDTRVGQTLAARTHAELAVITADIPVAWPPPYRPRRCLGSRRARA